MLPVVNFINQGGGIIWQKENVMPAEKRKTYQGGKHAKKVIFTVRVVDPVVKAADYAGRN